MTCRNCTWILLLSFCAWILLWAYLPTFTQSTPSLSFKWEGFFNEKLNFRDAGASINSCYQAPLIAEDQLFRANGFFSGWSCSRVGSPDKIYSLNYNDEDNRRYYCRRDNGLLIGDYYQTIELSDLEFISTWQEKPDFVSAACQYLKHGLADIREQKKVLYHCEAGRDRTGAVIALMAALLIESNGTILTKQMIDAIECDYEKSRSLSAEKYGRIRTLLTDMRDQTGSVSEFIRARCGDF